MTRERVLVIGLDCAPPALLFDRFETYMPNLSAFRERAIYAPMRSTEPPITMPAWACMTSGRDPGELGIYGFRKRTRGSYGLTLSNASDVRVPRIWNVLGDAGKQVSVLYVPPTYPVSEVSGSMVSCFLTPSAEHVHTHPEALSKDLAARFGAHCPDVSDFRSEDVEGVLDALYTSTQQHFRVAAHLWNTEDPDFMMMVEMGTDRIQHLLWKHIDATHPDHDSDHPWVREARDYYAFLDTQIGTLLELVGSDVNVLVVSDHGARTMRGGFRVNQWLWQEGLLVFREGAKPEGALVLDDVDWTKTQVWGAGGYYARLFVNVAGREPQGIVAPDGVDALLHDVESRLRTVMLPDGKPFRVRGARPGASYRAVRGLAPDLFLYLEDLDYRSLGTFGDSLFTASDDRGPDGCNHDWNGVFMAAGPRVVGHGPIDTCAIYDVGPTVFSLLDVPCPPEWLGTDRSGR